VVELGSENVTLAGPEATVQAYDTVRPGTGSFTVAVYVAGVPTTTSSGPEAVAVMGAQSACVSHPLLSIPSQSLKPAAQAMVHAPLVQAPVAFAAAHPWPQLPQLFASVCRLMVQASAGVKPQLA
jgi:hypothetical protein